MKEFLSYMKSTLLAAGKLCSGAQRLCSAGFSQLSSARIASFALLTTVSLALCIAAALLCTGCQDNDSPFRSVIPDEEDCLFAIKPLPIQGEEIPYGDSRALNPMSVDKENMIKQIAIFQYDAEDLLRQLKDNHGYFIYVDFTDAGNSDNTTTNFIPADKGYTRVTEKELPPLSSVLWTSTSSSLKTCVIANVSRSMVESALFPNGKNNLPADWAEFQNTSFDLPFLSEEEVEADKLVSGELELGHLKDIYMFGYYEGTVPLMGFTLGLGRTVARLKVTFSVEDKRKIDPDARFYAAVSNLGRQSSYFIKMDANSQPNISQAYLLDPERFDLSTGEAVIQFYSGPRINETINSDNEATTLLIWYVRPDEDGNYGIPDPTSDDWIAKAVKVPFGNAPKEGNYGVVRNTLYSFRVPLIFNSTGFGIEYMYSSTLRAENASPLPWTATSWGVNLYMDGENDSHSDTGSSHLKVDWNDDSWKGKMIKFYYTYDTENTYEYSYCNAKFATDPANVEGWADLPGYSENIGLETTSGTFDIILTDDVLNQIRQDGELIVYGYHYTITKIEIWEEGYASATPIEGEFTFAIVNNNNGWDWEHRGYMDGTNEHPYALDLGSTNSKGSGFLISNLLNTSYDSDKKAKYGVVDYVIYNDEKTFKLVDKPYAKRQVEFDFSQLTYAVKTGTDEISGDYIKIVDNALLPLQPTTGLSQDVIFYVSFPPTYEVGKKEGNTPESFNVTSRTVPVKVSIADAFSHVLTPTTGLRVEETTSLEHLLDGVNVTATKSYYGERINAITTAFPISNLTPTTTLTDKDGNAIPTNDVEIKNGSLTINNSEFTGTVYLHFDVPESATGDLKTYHYFDLTLPIKIGDTSNRRNLPITGTDPNTSNPDTNYPLTAGWGSSYNSGSQIISYTQTWGGRGWWLESEDLSEYDSVTIEFDDVQNGQIKVYVEYAYPDGDKKDDNGNQKYLNNDSDLGTTSPITVTLDSRYKDKVRQIIVQGNDGSNVSVHLTAAYLSPSGGNGNNDPTPTEKKYNFTLFNTNAQGQWQDGKGQGNDALDKGTLGTEWDLTHLINYDHSDEAINAYGYTAHTIEHHPEDDTEWKKTEYVEFRKNNDQIDNADKQIVFDFSNISYSVENDGTYVKKDGNNILPLAAGDAIVNVTLADGQPSGYTIENRTVKVKFTIADAFTHEIAAANEVTITNGLSLDNLMSRLGNMTVTKKYDGVNVNTVTGLTRWNGYNIGNDDVQCTGTGVSFSNGQFAVTDDAYGSVALTLHLTNNSGNLQTYKYPATVSLTIPVGSGNQGGTDPTPNIDDFTLISSQTYVFDDTEITNWSNASSTQSVTVNGTQYTGIVMAENNVISRVLTLDENYYVITVFAVKQWNQAHKLQFVLKYGENDISTTNGDVESDITHTNSVQNWDAISSDVINVSNNGDYTLSITHVGTNQGTPLIVLGYKIETYEPASN